MVSPRGGGLFLCTTSPSECPSNLPILPEPTGLRSPVMFPLSLSSAVAPPTTASEQQERAELLRETLSRSILLRSEERHSFYVRLIFERSPSYSSMDCTSEFVESCSARTSVTVKGLNNSKCHRRLLLSFSAGSQPPSSSSSSSASPPRLSPLTDVHAGAG